MSTTNPSLVSSEMEAIASFANSTEKRGSTLTLNELNYISDKQLHKKGGGGGSGPVEWDMLGLVVAGSDDPPELLAGDYSKLREKLENAFSTGSLDEPIYVGILEQVSSPAPLYFSFNIIVDETMPFGENAIYFVTEMSSFTLAFKSDNTLEWVEK